ncbi:MAG: AMP-binding protein [Rhodococcus ruber]|nr:AMP-binding protein [Rhodococcus ruber]
MREYTTPAQFTVGDDESVVRTVFTHAEKTPHRVMYSRPEGEDWVAVTARQFAEQVSGVAKGLIAAGVQPGDRVALLSATRYEWALFCGSTAVRWRR